MLTTAGGLFVAIPALMAYMFSKAGWKCSSWTSMPRRSKVSTSFLPKGWKRAAQPKRRLPDHPTVTTYFLFMLLKQATDDVPTINLTPMLDVVFNLIVFFMVGTKFVEMDDSIQVDVPKVSDAGPMTYGYAARVDGHSRRHKALDGTTVSAGDYQRPGGGEKAVS